MFPWIYGNSLIIKHKTLPAKLKCIQSRNEMCGVDVSWSGAHRCISRNTETSRRCSSSASICSSPNLGAACGSATSVYVWVLRFCSGGTEERYEHVDGTLAVLILAITSEKMADAHIFTSVSWSCVVANKCDVTGGIFVSGVGFIWRIQHYNIL